MPTGVYVRTKKYREKISQIMKGKIFSEEHRRKLSLALIGKKKLPQQGFQKGHKNFGENGENPFLGKKHSLETRLKMKKNNRTKKGKENPTWKGGYENRLWHNRQRRIKKLGNGGFHTLAEWGILKAQYNWTCPCCKKKEPNIKLTEDHIIPLSRGGSDNIENIQPLCLKCNFKKHTKIIKYEL